MSDEITAVEQQPTAPDSLADELLAVRCQLGERSALDELVERWHPSLWKYLRRLTGDDNTTAEILQDVWLRVLRGIPGLRDPSRLRPWLFGIARRAMIDVLRQEYAAPESVEVDVADVAAVEPDIDRIEDIALMYDVMGRLPPTEREVLALFYLEELTLKQIAEVVSVPVGTVKSRLFRARHLMRRELAKKGVTS